MRARDGPWGRSWPKSEDGRGISSVRAVVCGTRRSSTSATTRQGCEPAGSSLCCSRIHQTANNTMTTNPTMNPTMSPTVSPTNHPDDGARAVAERIRSGSNFLITSHRNPDGDALGSGLALQRLIRQLGKEAPVQRRDGFGKPLLNIPGASQGTIIDTLPADYPNAYDAVFIMEYPEVERTGYPVLPGPVVNIDHHLGNTMYGEINYLDLDAPSAGEMVLQIDRRHLGPPLDRETAIAMYVSLATDTAFFRHHHTPLRTPSPAAAL